MKFASVPKTMVLALTLLPAFTLGQSRNEDRRNFWFLNNTGQAVMEIYVSPHNVGYWGNDTLGAESILENGEGILITFNSAVSTSCIFDFRVVLEGGDVQEYSEGMDICRSNAVRFDDDGATSF